MIRFMKTDKLLHESLASRQYSSLQLSFSTIPTLSMKQVAGSPDNEKIAQLSDS